MYARLIMISVSQGSADVAYQLSELLAANMVGLPGFRTVTFFCDPENGEYVALSLWDSDTDAVISGRLLSAKMELAVKDLPVAQPVSKLYQVFTPAAVMDRTTDGVSPYFG